jgi:hypothetical protein
MQISRVAKSDTQFFISAKTRTAIPTTCGLVRDALVAASLDPIVRSIDFVPSTTVAATQVNLNAIVLVRDDGRYFLDVVPARPLRDVENEGLSLIAIEQFGLPSIVLTADDIRREPRYANSRLVWSYRLSRVGITLRMKILQTLLDDGPMTMASLLSTVRANQDPGPAVLALACSNLLELDLVSRPLGPLTIVRYRA